MDDDSGFASAPAAGPFTPALNSALGDAFGSSLADLSLNRGADSAASAIGADAFTHGRSISLSSSIREDLGDPYSMNVIAHEVAHALAGGGAGTTLIDQPNDRGEDAADAAGLAFGHYAEQAMSGPAPRLAPAHGGQALVHRHEIQGPWNIGQPIHETMTLESLKMAGVVGADVSYDDPEAWQYTRGVMFNDDPNGQLFDGPHSFSTGRDFLNDFSSAEEAAAGGAEYGPGDTLLQRSHFGDLQGLHGMAGKDGEDPAYTKAKMMMWAELATKVAEGEIDGDAQIDELVLANPLYEEMLALDPSLAGVNVGEFFGVEPGGEPGDLEARATGSLLHMIQDSYAKGHTEREDLGDGRMGDIVNFHSYGQQDHAAHGRADGLPAGCDLYDKAGARDAVEQGAAVIELIRAGVPPEEVVEYLDTNTFRTSPNIRPAESGAGFGHDDDHEVTESEALGQDGREEDEEAQEILAEGGYVNQCG